MLELVEMCLVPWKARVRLMKTMTCRQDVPLMHNLLHLHFTIRGGLDRSGLQRSLTILHASR